MNDALVITLTAGLVGTSCGLLSPFLVLRRAALMGDAVSHAVLPGIVLVWLLIGSRAELPMIAGAALFATVCVLAIDALRATGLVRTDAAIALVFPALFALGVLGVTQWAENVHLDLDATIYGEIAFTPFRTIDVGGTELARAPLVVGIVCAANLALIVALWKEFKATTFDPEFARTIRIAPALLSRLLLIAVAVTAVTAFDSVGAILVVTLLVVPGATAFLLSDRLWAMVAISVGVGWIGAIGGRELAFAYDASIAGAMGLACTACFVVALLGAPRHGLIARALQRRAQRARVRKAYP